MKVLRTFGSILVGIIFPVVLWLYSDLLKLAFSDVNSTTLEPKNCSFFITLDANNLISNSFESIFIDAKDKEFIDHLVQFIKSGRPTEERRKDPGINFKGLFSYFQDEFEGKSIEGFVVPILSAHKFEKHIRDWFSDEISFKIIDQNAIIVSSTSKNASLEKYLKTVSFHENSVESANHTELLQFSRQKELLFSNFSVKNLKLLLNEKKNETEIEGTFKVKNYSFVEYTHKRLKANGFALYSTILPKGLDSALTSISAYPAPTIASLSINYYGLELVNLSKGITPVPKVDLLINFSKDHKLTHIQVLSLLDSLGYEKEFVEERLNQGKLYLTIEENSILLAQDKDAKISKVESNLLFSSEGDLAELLSVSGNNLVTAMLEMNNVYGASKRFIAATEKVNIIVTGTKGNGHITGTLKFKENKELLVEGLRLLIDLN